MAISEDDYLCTCGHTDEDHQDDDSSYCEKCDCVDYEPWSEILNPY